ncbi:MAG TPA: ComEA family DNA-binding protein [Candidatus Limnocylindrales bacterium]|nr:ComEA family DNA-binding protein [Candidatus Limnocylindrales bacterium]
MESSSAPWRVIETTEPEPVPPERGPGPRGLPWPAIGVALIAIVVAVVAILVTARGEPEIGIDGAVGLGAGSGGQGGTWSPDPALNAGDIVVAVAGAVMRPGVYRLPAGSRVADAIEAAGGYGATVDAARVDQGLNLAAVVKDGDKIRVPVRGEAGAGTAAAGEPATSTAGADGGLVNLNSADAATLDALPGVGPATAAKIIAAREERPFVSIDDLVARKVVGAATLEKLRALVDVGR